MRMLRMRASELGELYALIKMYKQVYGNVSETLINEIEKAYQESKENGPKAEAAYSITNPRGAGRKSEITEEKIQKAADLRVRGYKMRGIASEMGCSASYVFKLIREQDKME